MTPPAVLRVLERRIGLDPESVGPRALAAAVAERCRAVGAADPAAYAVRLEADPAEVQALVECVVVPETWFFRGGALFARLAARAGEVLAASPRGRVFRALSVPCSTGEEPYSLAIAFADAGLPADRWEIDAVDVSPVSLAAAARGVYRDLSFRQTPPDLQPRHFRPVKGGWELSPGIRGRVRFHAGNVLDPGLLADRAGSYDLVLCRNLLIYLTPAARRRAVDMLERRLAPGGWLAVGHAEPSALDGRGFRRVGGDELFVFAHGPGDNALSPGRAGVESASGTVSFPAARSGPTTPEPLPSGMPGSSDLFPQPQKGRDRVGVEAATHGTQTPSAGSLAPHPSHPLQGGREPETAAAGLAAARRLADAGQLGPALAECERGLAVQPSADGFALLGLIRQARGELDLAREAARKALYLDPNHREALALGSHLSAAAGRTDEAAAYRARLARLASAGGES